VCPATLCRRRLTGEIFIRPLLHLWLGQSPPDYERVAGILTRKVVSPTGDDDFVRVTVGQVGDQVLVTPLARGAGVITSLVRADGLLHIPRFSEGVDAGSSVEVMLFRPLEAIRRTVVAIGSHDPMLDLLGQYLAARFPGYRLASANVGSLGGLVAQRRGHAHVSGTHLLDPETGEYNMAYIRRTLGTMPVRVITFAHREQGLIVAPGNPEGIQSLDDLTRVRYVNRQRGAGTRVLLDYELERRGIAPDEVNGYDREEYTHLAVAAAIASDFIPVTFERYDLVIPERFWDLPMIQYVIALLRDDEFQAAVAAQPGYDVSEMGQEVTL